jgi:mannose-6-phosphate isomerase-like protein (cupin superfamily)
MRLEDLISEKESYNFESALEEFLSNPLFAGTKVDSWLIENNPYRRPVWFDKHNNLDFKVPLKLDNYFTRSSLLAHRLLCNIYHSDFVFLPEQADSSLRENLNMFYSSRTKVLGQILRPVLEYHAFDFLEEEIDVSGNWTKEELESYFLFLPEDQATSENKLVSAILSSVNPERAATNIIVQFAIDFLSEASAVARKVMGSFGEVQSELFKLFIDEYGYGVHSTKHSTLYENLLRSHNLSAQPHTYWQYYLTSSFLIPNYFQYLALNHSKIFHYLGAVYYAETTYYRICQQLSGMLKNIFGKTTETAYFDEHVHIDRHHSRMAFHKMICPLVDRYGATVIKDIVTGYEEFKLISEISEPDFIEQLKLIDNWEKSVLPRHNVGISLPNKEARNMSNHFVKLNGDYDTPTVYDTDITYIVDSGVLEVMLGINCNISIDPSQALVIPKGRLHGVRGSSERCVYSTLRSEFNF